MSERRMTVGEFKKRLEGIPDHYEITFGGCLDFYRVKARGDTLVDVEFNQLIYTDRNGRYHIDDAG